MPADNWWDSILTELGPGWQAKFADSGSGDVSTPEVSFFNPNSTDTLTKMPGAGGTQDAPIDLWNRSTYDLPYSAKNDWTYSPLQLGYKQSDLDKLTAAGISGLPSWMNKDSLHSNQFSTGGDDYIDKFIEAYQMGSGTFNNDDRAAGVLRHMGWEDSKDGRSYIGSGGNIPGSIGTGSSIITSYIPDPGVSREWGNTETQNFVENYLMSKWAPNDGGFFGTKNLTEMGAGLGMVAAPIAGLGALGGFAGLAGAGAAGAGVGAGAGLGAELGGLSAAQIASEFPAMAGTSLWGSGAAASPGFFGSGIGAAGTANATLGGLFGTGLGLDGAALSNLPVGMTLGDVLSGGWDKISGALDKMDWAKLAGGMASGLLGGEQLPMSLYTGGMSAGPAPMTVGIPQDGGSSGSSKMGGSIMPTASVMGAYKSQDDDFKREYFRSIF